MKGSCIWLRVAELCLEPQMLSLELWPSGSPICCVWCSKPSDLKLSRATQRLVLAAGWLAHALTAASATTTMACPRVQRALALTLS